MDIFNYFFTVIDKEGNIYNSLDMRLYKDLYHNEVIKIFLNENKDYFKNYPNDFYEQINKFSKDGHVLFYNMTENSKAGIIYLPNTLTSLQHEFLEKQNFSNAYLYVYKNNIQIDKTNNFNINDYKGKTK